MKEYTIEEIENTKDPGILAEILRRGEDNEVSKCAVRNLNCPSEALAEVLKKENLRRREGIEIPFGFFDAISQHAAFNPNCPPKARLDWLEATGKLTKYNPKIHELEKTPIDKDLEELRKLL